jgi:phage gp46-like protein
MPTIKIRWENDDQVADVELEDGLIGLFGGLLSALLISIFTDRQANESDPVPDGTSDRRGWWGDDYGGDGPIGSRIWLVEGEKMIPGSLRRVRTYLDEATKWFVEDGIAAEIRIEVMMARVDALGAKIAVLSPDEIAPRWSQLWIETDPQAA